MVVKKLVNLLGSPMEFSITSGIYTCGILLGYFSLDTSGFNCLGYFKLLFKIVLLFARFA